MLNQHFSSSLPPCSWILYLPYHHPASSTGKWGIRGCGQSLMAPLCCSFLFTLLLSSSKGPSHGLQFLQDKPAAFQAFLLAEEESLLYCLNHLSPLPSFLTLLFMQFLNFFLLSLLCCPVFCSFMSMPPPGTAQLCPVVVPFGGSWTWTCLK